MPITSSDIKLKLSIKTGAAGNSLAQSDVDESLGKYISTTEITSGSANNLFDDITGDENAASDVEYRCVFIHNSHASLTYQSPKVWLGGPRFTAEADDDIFTSDTHGLSDGQAVRLTASKGTDTLPGGFDSSTTYYVRDSATNTFKLALTAGGAAVNVSSDGTGEAYKYGTTTVAIALDDTAASAIGSGSAQAAEIATEGTTPTGVGAFSTPVTKSGGISLGNLSAGQCRAVWVRRTATNSSAANSDGITIRVEGDTAA